MGKRRRVKGRGKRGRVKCGKGDRVRGGGKGDALMVGKRGKG